ncbi:MAG: hypothetical protein A2844_02045 [Candidatus Ryanbacteria bacterium RIFCSPHIGHO2_01_FULL_48_80]|nr:MAG: hypothetical protein A2844_02045 [Candidatus Ryanbacteria bacterium RIFCSPHIGHO2_01_FULL_48_80]OGZ50554.1 MAG: hypothetical protein A3C83_02555 [Candidatus Ryanbacteria bacterium RIFCSPHIGHO2_02_FULL_47_25]
MAAERIRKIYIPMVILPLFFATATFAEKDLIEKYFSEGATTTPQTLEEALELKRQVLRALGLPPDTPTSIAELLNENVNQRSIITKIKNDIKLTFNTEEFSPNKRVRAQIEGFGTNPRTSRITWLHNGKRALSGSGEVSYEFTLGDIGTSDTLIVTVDDGTQAPIVIRKTIYPARIHFTWFADSYTPPWYRGKAHGTPQSDITVAATPEFRIFANRLDEANLIYTWSVDGRKMAANGNSGTGKNLFTFSPSSVSDISYEIGLEVKDARERIKTKETTTVTPVKPELIFYERLPLFGIKNWLTLNFSEIASGKSATIELEPFFISKKSLNNIQYTWKVNGQALENKNKNARRLFFSTEEGSSGKQSIGVSYQNLKNIFERGNGEAHITIQ